MKKYGIGLYTPEIKNQRPEIKKVYHSPYQEELSAYRYREYLYSLRYYFDKKNKGGPYRGD